MFQIRKFILLVSLLSISKGFHVEINIINKDPSTSLKIICIPPSKKLDIAKKDKVLWHGTQLGKDDQQNLSKKFGMDLLIYNMSINASKKHQCYLVAPESLLVNLEKIKFNNILKKRMTRDDGTASIPMENGVCPPGHRIAEDRCFPCFPGSYTSGQQTECFLCPKDFYMDKQAADSCWPCPAGKNTLAQGASSAESCVDLDETGHAKIKQSPPWILIYIIIGVIILALWILTVYLFIRYRKKRSKDDADEGTFLSLFKRKKSTKKRPSADDHVYERISDTDKEEPIYAEIGEYGDDYEEPKKPSKSHDYLDLDAPNLPPKQEDSRKGSDYKTGSKSGQMKSRSDENYEVPIGRRSYRQFGDPTRRILSDEYEVPIRTQFNNSYLEFPDISEDHVYSDINSEDEMKSDEGDENKIISSANLTFVTDRFPTENTRQKPSF